MRYSRRSSSATRSRRGRSSAGVPRELERICLKCLSKRMADRYETAGDLADDLRTWLVSEASTDTFSPAAERGAAGTRGRSARPR